jgi:hypothetical protein
MILLTNKYEEKQGLGAAVPETQPSGSEYTLISGGLFFPGSDQQQPSLLHIRIRHFTERII